MNYWLSAERWRLSGVAGVMLAAGATLLAGCDAKKGDAATTTAKDSAVLAERAARVDAAIADSSNAGDAIKDGSPIARWLLPKKLGEVSGAAMSADGRLFVQDDSHARVTEIDFRSGKIVKSFDLKPDPGPVDFESITVAGGRIYLLTSKGVLYELSEGQDDEKVAYRTIDTGLMAKCEFEGAAFDSTSNTILLACKVVLEKALERAVVIYKWKLGGGAAAPARITIPNGAIKLLGTKVMNPSDITVDPKTGNYFLISGREKVIVEITPAGAVVSAVELTGNHPQPEGIAITRDGILIIADESGGKGSAAITVYKKP
jgi:uncharacterized protein YjiK